LDLEKNPLEDYNMANRIQYKLLANLFRYPDESYKEDVKSFIKMVSYKYPDVVSEMKRFSDFIATKDLYEIEEVFNKTFHIQAICFLDLGYVLFREDYKRGEFLVNMKREQAKINHDCGNELADNLPNVLDLMSKIDDEDFLDELSVRIVIPAAQKMLKEFDEKRMELRLKIMRKKEKVVIQENLEGGNIYQHVIMSLIMILEEDFKHVDYNDPIIEPNLQSAFLSNCSSCSINHEPLKTVPQ